ncbi:hypothetical protein E2C01_076458 [Portunus trituberculatus]|uniref:Uncharacterized protein n=1 Tax=Portunus trituberculatus TaxID=210409 RepID=A0A5B7IHQ1_PORTR|nr:hypothetical protein [Portunus trituberculatus]
MFLVLLNPNLESVCPSAGDRLRAAGKAGTYLAIRKAPNTEQPPCLA